MKIEIELDPALLEGLSASIRAQLNDDAAKRASFLQFALGELLGWMSGHITYVSITEQYTNWLAELFLLFYPEEPPSADRLYNDFSIPYGRAAYIARVLLEKRHSSWRQRGREALKRTLLNKLPEAEKNIEDGDDTRHVPVTMHKIAYREFSVVVEDLLRKDGNLPPPLNKGSFSDHKTIDIPSLFFRPVIDMI